MVCRVRCNADAASDDDSPCVMDGMSCCRNGDCRGNDEIMLMVFCAMVAMILSVCVMLALSCDAEGGGVFS